MILCSIDLSDFINEKLSVKKNESHILEAGHEINHKKYWVNFLIQENRNKRKISNNEISIYFLFLFVLIMF